MHDSIAIASYLKKEMLKFRAMCDRLSCSQDLDPVDGGINWWDTGSEKDL